MIPGLTESLLQQHATAGSIRRGRDYYREGAVRSVVIRGREVQAQVEGSSYEPYRVQVGFDDGGVTSTRCTCPFEGGGWCKHVVAVLLYCLHDAEAVTERPPLDALLGELSRDELAALVLDLAAYDPDLAERVELWQMRHRAMAAGGNAGGRKTSVDGRAVRQRVRAILHALDRMRSSEAYWHVGEVVEEVRRELENARTFVEAGDGRNALRYLDALTEVYVEDWVNLDDSDGEAGGLFVEIGEAWTEAVLTADLTPDERAEWAEKLAGWQDVVDDYGIDDAFGAAVAAAEQGWDDPALRRVLDEGVITEHGAWEDEAPWYADTLAEARLRVLDRQGRHEAYLRLAEAEGQVGLYHTMLVRLGRVAEAAAKALASVSRVDDAFAVAQALRGKEALEEALRVGERGLALDGYGKARLAAWVCELARGMGRPERALEAARVAFREAPGLDAYRQVRDLAGPAWPALRAEMLDALRGEYVPATVSVDVFLDEGLLDDAIAAVERHPFYDTVRRVVEVVASVRPEWVVGAAKRQAEPIMDAGRSRDYEHAVDWLAHVQAAYRTLDRMDEWDAYLASLREKHGRKYKLMGLLKERF